MDGCATSGFFKRTDSFWLSEAITSGNIELINYLESQGQKHTDPIMVALYAERYEIAKHYAKEKKIDYSPTLLMVKASGILDVEVWKFCLSELGCVLSSRCYLSIFVSRFDEGLQFLREKKCPMNLKELTSEFFEKNMDEESLQYFLAEEPTAEQYITDEVVALAMDQHRYEVVKTLITSLKKNYVLTSKDVIACLSAPRYSSYATKFLDLFLERGYMFGRNDMVEALVSHDIRLRSDPDNSLSKFLIVKKAFPKSELDDTLLHMLENLPNERVRKIAVEKYTELRNLIA